MPTLNADEAPAVRVGIEESKAWCVGDVNGEGDNARSDPIRS
jgi:hypothetical protein